MLSRDSVWVVDFMRISCRGRSFFFHIIVSGTPKIYVQGNARGRFTFYSGFAACICMIFFYSIRSLFHFQEETLSTEINIHCFGNIHYKSFNTDDLKRIWEMCSPIRAWIKSLHNTYGSNLHRIHIAESNRWIIHITEHNH